MTNYSIKNLPIFLTPEDTVEFIHEGKAVVMTICKDWRFTTSRFYMEVDSPTTGVIVKGSCSALFAHVLKLKDEDKEALAVKFMGGDYIGGGSFPWCKGMEGLTRYILALLSLNNGGTVEALLDKKPEDKLSPEDRKRYDATKAALDATSWDGHKADVKALMEALTGWSF